MRKPRLEPFEMLIRVAYLPHKEWNGYNVSGEGVARIGEAQIPIKVFVGLQYTNAEHPMTDFSLEVRTDDFAEVVKAANRREPIAQLEEPKSKTRG